MSVIPEMMEGTLFHNVLFYPLLAISAFLWFIYYRQMTSRFVEMGNKIPGPETVPVFGNALLAVKHNTPDRFLEYALREAVKYGKVVRVWLGPRRLLVFLYDPRDIELILSSNVHLEKSKEYRWFKPWLGEGLLISSGDKWRSHRKLIAPTFHLNVLKGFVGLFNENGRTLVKRLKKECDSGRVFDIHDYMSESTVDILLETAMGITRTTQDHSGYDYAMAVMKLCDIIHQRTYKFWLRLDPIFKMSKYAKEQDRLIGIIHGLSRKVIARKQEALEKSELAAHLRPVSSITPSSEETSESKEPEQSVAGTFFDEKGYIKDDLDDDVGEKKRKAFLDLMLEIRQAGANLTDEEIKEEVDTIMFEGHDTTAAGSSFALCLLGIHQDIQEKVMEELDSIFGDSDRPATFADTLEMKYLERVILETLRMYPPVPVIARRPQHDLKLASGDYVLPKGCTAVISTIKLHRCPEFYPNPDQFNPDNFLPEKMAARHYYSYIPFSAGPRSCVGRKYAMLKLKVLLSTVLRNYKMVSHLTEKDFRLQADIILKRTDGFRLQIVPRRPAKAAA
ncbi:cytochrome P450 4g15 [Anabrus simplex]|uniref:cytochrome P450 4g15 n=1 Tax=Anabrus simplex TaxID=316456 RepID=UPI0035A33C95